MDPIETYIEAIDPNRQVAYRKLLETVKANIPEGFELIMQYNMPSFVVPLERFPKGYHCTPGEALPFIALGVQKGHIGLYHMGIYADPTLLKWFEEAYAKRVPTKLNMGKSCIRFTNVKNIPYDLVGELVSKMSVEEWLDRYESR